MQKHTVYLFFCRVNRVNASGCFFISATDGGDSMQTQVFALSKNLTRKLYKEVQFSCPHRIIEAVQPELNLFAVQMAS